MNTYNVSGQLPNGVYVSLTVKADNATDAIKKATDAEPELKVQNVVRTGVADA